MAPGIDPAPPVPIGGHDKDDFIQVWRGIAVSLVVYYHLTDRVPYTALGASAPPSLPFYSGKLGVLVFFIISGFLIAASIKGCPSLASFYAKRVSRIWPLFVLAALVTFTFLQFVPPPAVAYGPKPFFTERRGLLDLIGTIFFLEDLGFEWVDGAYWSILVELKFYLWIGVLAWASPLGFGRVFALFAFVLAFAEMAFHLIGTPVALAAAQLLNGVFVAQYLPFFAIGVLLYTGGSRDLLTVNIVMAIAQSGLKIASNPNFDLMATIYFAMAFSALLAVDGLALRSWIFRKLGDYSYSWYLFHQIIGLSAIRYTAPMLGIDAAVAVALAFTLSLAVAASKIAEWRFRRIVYRWLMRLFTLLRLDRLALTPGRSPGTIPRTA
jgi:peptidoglycan/LPS O-acetylase OafA/YrhL